MGKQADDLARRFEEANGQLIATVAGLSDAQWDAPGVDEGRTIGVTAHHVASSLPPLLGLMQAVGNGQPAPPVTWDMIHANNAEHARQAAGVGRAETLELLRTNGAAVSAALRAMSDEQLDRTTLVPLLGEQPVSAAQLAESLVIGHIGMHAPGIEQAARNA